MVQHVKEIATLPTIQMCRCEYAGSKCESYQELVPSSLDSSQQKRVVFDSCPRCVGVTISFLSDGESPSVPCNMEQDERGHFVPLSRIGK